MLNLPLAYIEAKLILDGKKYDVEHYKIEFAQPTDFKGQPQHEIKGGQMLITLTQAADNNLYLWAKTATKLKDGEVIFQTDLGMTVLRVNFTNAYCIKLAREINATAGTKTTLVISPENVSLNGTEHTNYWV